MNSRILRGALMYGCGGALFILSACSDTKTLTPEDLVTSATLVAKFIPSGVGAQPCDDLAPIVDGQFFDYEWGDTEPLFVQMTGSNGSGGADFILEMRAGWQDGRRRFGQIDRNRLFLMFRWGDDDQDRWPDLLVYGTPHPLTGEIVPSPIPVTGRGECDVEGDLVDPANWTRLNPNGGEDQLMILIKEVDESLSLAEQTRGLANLNAEVFRAIGGDGLDIETSLTHASGPTDVWIWRAGRTNDHPAYQRSNWENYDSHKRNPPQGDIHSNVVDVPEQEWKNFTNFSGFFQDYFIDESGMLQNDKGRDVKGRVPLPVFIKNFNDDVALPIRITHPDPRIFGRGDGSKFDGFVLNGTLPVDQSMWDEQSWFFSVAGCDSIVPTRAEKSTELWSEKLKQAGLEFDFQFGWALKTPTGSRKDVRGKGVWNTLTDKIEPTWTVELQRELDTPQSDDLEFIATGDKKRYLMSIVVSDRSGSICSGSYPILLEFEDFDPNATVFVDLEDKCQP